MAEARSLHRSLPASLIDGDVVDRRIDGLDRQSRGYRPEIDGLRALAVCAVVLFHAQFRIGNVTLLPGGFLGVDIFLVISGYLIGGILLREIGEGRFSLMAFYERRARRILPAFYVVLLSTIPLGWLLLLPTGMKDYAAGLVAATVSMSNILFSHQVSYDAPDSLVNPLIHTWSLSLEEQFYLLFPALLLLLARFSAPVKMMALIGVCAASLIVAETTTHYAPEASFFLLPSRIFELGAGALLALREVQSPGDANGSRILPLVGLAAVLASICAMPLHLHHPGALTLIPVIGTALIIRYSHRREPVGAWLSTRPMVAVGLISYSLYLWHQPVLAFGRLMRADQPDPFTKAMWIVIAVLLAIATFILVEKPTRDRSRVSSRTIWMIAGGGAVTLIAFGLGLYLSGGAPGRFSGPLGAIAKAEIVDEAGIFQGHRGCMNFVPADGPCRFATGSKPGYDILLLGDSHARLLSGALIDRLKSVPSVSSITLLTRGGCPFLRGLTRIDGLSRPCPESYNAARERYVLGRPGGVVVLMMRMPVLVEHSRFDNGAGGVEGGFAPYLSRAGSFPYGAVTDAEIEARLKQTVGTLLANGLKVVLVYPVPEMGWNIPLKLLQLAREKPTGSWLAPREAAVSRRQFLERSRRSYALLDAVGNHPDLARVYPERIFCRGDQCLSHDGTAIYYRDDNHLSRTGADRLVDHIIGTIEYRWPMPAS